MKVFVATFDTNYGEEVEIICALTEKSANNMVSAYAKGWGYVLDELDVSKEGVVFEGGGD